MRPFCKVAYDVPAQNHSCGMRSASCSTSCPGGRGRTPTGECSAKQAVPRARLQVRTDEAARLKATNARLVWKNYDLRQERQRLNDGLARAQQAADDAAQEVCTNCVSGHCAVPLHGDVSIFAKMVHRKIEEHFTYVS